MVSVLDFPLTVGLEFCTRDREERILDSRDGPRQCLATPANTGINDPNIRVIGMSSFGLWEITLCCFQLVRFGLGVSIFAHVVFFSDRVVK